MRERLRLIVRGVVQGVGFRPFVYRLAIREGIAGSVMNTPEGVVIEAEGPRSSLEAFRLAIEPERPPRASIHGIEAVWLDAIGATDFRILDSHAPGGPTTLVPADIATCDDCRAEIADPANRRYRYPFANCTNCGPRYSLIESLPYDRARTSMRAFAMCPACAAEYRDPHNRRFHAQPNACAACGPMVALWDADGRTLATGDAAMTQAAAALRDGRLVAVKGLGGFHLMALASHDAAVRDLRARKHREEKPLALMASSIAEAAALCEVSAAERRLLEAPEAPIVLLRRRDGAVAVAPSVAPNNPWLGVMLPGTPLHHVLLADVGEAVVATSGNRAEEPICTDEHEALERLAGLADCFLVHDRPIVRHVDDSIARVQLGREVLLRRARGYAPLPVSLTSPVPQIVAVGAHQKNTVAVSVASQVFLSQHIGDLDTAEAREAFMRVLGSLQSLYHVTPERMAADLHPDYASTRIAVASGVPVTLIQHHLAHVLACAAEHGLAGEWLGVAWDGTGAGPDGTVWGGEFLLVDDERWARLACLRPFRLPGGERAAREPRRSAFGVSHELGLPPADLLAGVASEAEQGLWRRAIDRHLNAPVTSSAGRLFDAVASLLAVRHHASYEGQAAMELEWAADPREQTAYPWTLDAGDRDRSTPWVADWGPAIRALLDDRASGTPVPVLAARWHNTMADVIATVAATAGRPRVVLSGGCFQNVVLVEQVDRRLRAAGLTPHWHQQVPPNDGGIALGQLIGAARERRQSAAWGVRASTKEGYVSCV
ncbi:MAG: carbamoyltransferase HypF [Acidobacteria bacterium]|nr:carbamoyltransferase HypF [Acidobacteriota bacterium]